MPWGGAFGTTGPDAGFALRLVAGRALTLAKGEHRADADAVIAGLAAARASRLGRAPTGEDVDAGVALLGYETAGLPPAVVDDLTTRRRRLIAGAAHHPDRVHRVVGTVEPGVLIEEPAAILTQMAAGAVLVR